jgi:hypothetical protein
VIRDDVVAMRSESILQALARCGLARANDDAHGARARPVRQQVLHDAIDL